MTPTLFGRWQSRLLLLGTVGVLVTLPFALGWVGPGGDFAFWGVLIYVALFGLGWDGLYNYLQKFRWDRDWPGILQLFAGVWEGVFLFFLIKVLGLPGIPSEISVGGFVAHYSLVWVAVYGASQSMMRILFPRWRFRGGQWL